MEQLQSTIIVSLGLGGQALELIQNDRGQFDIVLAGPHSRVILEGGFFGRAYAERAFGVWAMQLCKNRVQP
jgi:hypothetical protein